MFLSKSDLKSVIYEYQLDQIIEVTTSNTTNDDIVLMAIGAAVEEIKSYLSPNLQDRWKDGRSRYDVQAIFSATGSARNPLILELCKNIAVYYLCRLSNVDMIEQKVKERYERAIDWLEKVSGTGKSAGAPSINPDLPMLSFDPTTDDSLSWRMGSREKFNHE